MTTKPEELDSARRVPNSDNIKILLGMVAIYIVYILLGVFLNISPLGQISAIRRLTFLIAVYGMTALALNIQWGYAGIPNLGVAGFMAVGVYTTAMLAKPALAEATRPTAVPGLGMPLWIAIIGGILAATLLSVVVGLAAIRLSADYFAIATLVMAEAIRLIYKSPSVRKFSVVGHTMGTGGPRGIILRVKLFGEVYKNDVYFALVDGIASFLHADRPVDPILEKLFITFVLLIVFLLYYWVLQRLGKSPFGRVLKGIREDEKVTNTLGKNTTMFKLKVFMLGSAMMAFAGILWQIPQGSVTPDFFKPQTTIFVLVVLIIGGVGSNTGSVVGAIVFISFLFEGPRYLKNVLQTYLEIGNAPQTILQAIGALGSLDPMPLLLFLFENLPTLQRIVVGLSLILLMRYLPQGLLGNRMEIATTINLEDQVESKSNETDG